MAVAAIDTVVRDVMFVAEGNRLILGDADIGNIGAPVHAVSEGQKGARPDYGGSDADLRDMICAWMKYLSHAVKNGPYRRATEYREVRDALRALQSVYSKSNSVKVQKILSDSKVGWITGGTNRRKGGAALSGLAA